MLGHGILRFAIPLLHLTVVACGQTTLPPERQSSGGSSSSESACGTGTGTATANCTGTTTTGTATRTGTGCSSIARSLFCVGTGVQTETLAPTHCSTGTSTGIGIDRTFKCVVVTSGCGPESILSCDTGSATGVSTGTGTGTATSTATHG